MNKPVLPMSSLSLKLPTADRSIETYRLAASRMFPAKLEGTLNRVAFSAAHVVADPFADKFVSFGAIVDFGSRKRHAFGLSVAGPRPNPRVCLRRKENVEIEWRGV